MLVDYEWCFKGPNTILYFLVFLGRGGVGGRGDRRVNPLVLYHKLGGQIMGFLLGQT